MSTRVRRILAAGKKVSFGGIFQGVLSRGGATKFAVRSALSKARAKGSVKFADGLYWSATETGNKRPPASRNGKPGAKSVAG